MFAIPFFQGMLPRYHNRHIPGIVMTISWIVYLPEYPWPDFQ